MACGGCAKRGRVPAPKVKTAPSPVGAVPPGVTVGQLFRIKGKPGLYLATANGAKPVTVML